MEFDEERTIDQKTAITAAFRVQNKAAEWLRSAEYKGSDAEKTALMLVSSTPAMLFYSERKAQLDKLDRKSLTPQQKKLRERLREELSRYNDKLKEFAYKNPSARTADVSIVAAELHNWMPGFQANGEMESLIKGMCSELAFEQMMEAADIRYRPGTVREDLDAGDFYIYDIEGRRHKVDVKSSFMGLGAQDGDESGIRKEGDVFKIISPVNEKMFDGGFFIDKEFAEVGGQWLAAELRKAGVRV